MSETCLWVCVPAGLDFVGRHVSLELFVCNGVPQNACWKPRSTELTLAALWVVSGRAFGWYFPYYGSQKSRGVLFLEKKGPCQECPGCRRNWFPQKVNNSRNSDKKNTIFRKGTRGKMTPQVSSIQWQSPFLIYSRNSFILKEIAKT